MAHGVPSEPTYQNRMEPLDHGYPWPISGALTAVVGDLAALLGSLGYCGNRRSGLLGASTPNKEPVEQQMLPWSGGMVSILYIS